MADRSDFVNSATLTHHLIKSKEPEQVRLPEVLQNSLETVSNSNRTPKWLIGGPDTRRFAACLLPASRVLLQNTIESEFAGSDAMLPDRRTTYNAAFAKPGFYSIQL